MKRLISLIHTYWNTISVLLLGLGLVWIVSSRVSAEQSTAPGIAQPQEGFLAPDFQLTSLAGENIRLSDLRGRAVILNFWASWCPPCRAEMPAIQAVHEKYSAEDLIVVAINASSQDNLDAAQEFLDSLNLSFLVLKDTTGSVQELYQVTALPTTFFIDRQGIIQKLVIGGPMSEALLNVTAQSIQEATP